MASPSSPRLIHNTSSSVFLISIISHILTKTSTVLSTSLSGRSVNSLLQGDRPRNPPHPTLHHHLARQCTRRPCRPHGLSEQRPHSLLSGLLPLWPSPRT